MEEPVATCSGHCAPEAAPRIVVVGSTGAGKTRLARELSRRFYVPHVEMDALNFDPGWNPLASVDPETFRERVRSAVEGHAWVVDGNYGVARDLVWPRATALVWLDYPLRVVMWRTFWRTIKRSITRERLWNGARERLWVQFFSRDSIFLWVLQRYWWRRRAYPRILEEPEHAMLRVFRHRSPRETRTWLATLTAQDLVTAWR